MIYITNLIYMKIANSFIHGGIFGHPYYHFTFLSLCTSLDPPNLMSSCCTVFSLNLIFCSYSLLSSHLQILPPFPSMTRLCLITCILDYINTTERRWSGWALLCTNFRMLPLSQCRILIIPTLEVMKLVLQCSWILIL